MNGILKRRVATAVGVTKSWINPDNDCPDNDCPDNHCPRMTKFEGAHNSSIIRHPLRSTTAAMKRKGIIITVAFLENVDENL